MLTLTELREKIAETLDEVTILEILEINSFELVEAFSDKIEAKYEQLSFDFSEEETD